MFLLQQITLLQGEHEVELAASLGVIQRVDEKVHVVDLAYLLDELVDLAQEVFRVDVVEQVDVQLVLSEQSERFAESSFLYHAYGGFEQENARLDSL